MKPPRFEYTQASSVEETLELLQRYDGQAKILAGGQSLIPLLNFRLTRPEALVDINRITELNEVRVDNGQVSIGAMVRQRALEINETVKAVVPILSEALRNVGHVTIRNRGTVGGSLAHADPAAELPLVAVTLGAEIVMQGTDGGRTVPAADFFMGPLTTSVEPDEILTEVRFERQPEGVGVCVEELARRRGDFAIVAIAASVSLTSEGVCDSVRLGAGGVGPIPQRLEAAESLLSSQEPTPALIVEAGHAAASAVEPMEDVHASAEYRQDMTRVLMRRAIEKAVARASGGTT